MTKKVKSVDAVDLAKKTTEGLLSLMTVSGSVETSTLPSDNQEEQTISVTIKAPEEAGLLIGAHGSTLAAIQSFVAISLKQQTDVWYRVVVDVGDWREKQEEYLKGLAQQAAQRTKATHEPQHLYNLTSSQRRVIHTVLGEDPLLETESQGEGESRFLIVRMKENK